MSVAKCDRFCVIEEDGTLELGDNIKTLCFHQTLNVFLVTTKDNRIRVFDPHTSLKLADVHLYGHGKFNYI